MLLVHTLNSTNYIKTMIKKLFFAIYFLIITTDLNSKESDVHIQSGQTWYLDKRSNKFSSYNSKVLYFFSTDAYSTYKARKFSDWDIFSIVDTRDLVRLNKGDKIEILKPRHGESVYEVKLLDGFEKNKNYFVIKDDLIDHFELIEQTDET